MLERYKSLRANLVHCSDLGRKAFRVAETKMYKVTMNTQFICEKNGSVSIAVEIFRLASNLTTHLQIDKIMQCLNDDTLAKYELPAHLQKLEKIAKECVDDAMDIKREFETWEKNAQAIRKACTDENRKYSSL